MQEPGWWTLDKVGGVVKEHNNRWGAYRWNKDQESPVRNFPTLSKAKEFLEQNAKGDSGAPNEKI